MRRFSTIALAGALVAGLALQSQPVHAAGCADYPSQRDAQVRLRQDPTDPEGLDPDGNGIACERNGPLYDYTPVPRPNAATPAPQTTPEAESPTPSDDEPAPSANNDDNGSSSTPAPAATATPGVRSPLLGAAPPPLWALQGGAPPPYTKPAPTAAAGSSATPAAGGLAYVQGSDSTIGAVVMQRALGVIQPPNTGDGGLLIP